MHLGIGVLLAVSELCRNWITLSPWLHAGQAGLLVSVQESPGLLSLSTRETGKVADSTCGPVCLPGSMDASSGGAGHLSVR
jgi:hypothetical protein